KRVNLLTAAGTAVCLRRNTAETRHRGHGPLMLDLQKAGADRARSNLRVRAGARPARPGVGGAQDAVEQAREAGIEVVAAQEVVAARALVAAPDDAGLAEDLEVVASGRLADR